MSQLAVDILAVVGLIASIASLVLAVVAIWLSIVFYRLSRDQAESSSKNANEIATSVARLEKVFDGLYSDTFAMMKDTVTDMRQHIWHRPVEAPSESAATDEPDPVLSKLEEFSAQLGIADDKIEELRRRLAPVVEESAEAAVLPRPIRMRIQQLLQLRTLKNRSPLTLSEINEALSHRGSVDSGDVVNALFELGRRGIVQWDGPKTTITGENVFWWVPRDQRETDVTPPDPARD